MTVSSPASLGALLAGCRVVDLSVTIAEDLPAHWSTHMPFQVKTFNWFAERRSPGGLAWNRCGPYATRWMAIDEHTGTHLDAPAHFIPPPGSGLPDAGEQGLVTVEQVPPELTMGPCAVVDAPAPAAGRPGASPRIGPDVVLDWEARHGRIEPGEVVLLRTGWDRFYRRGADGAEYLHDVVVTGRSPGWPAPGPDTVELLLERGVRCLGIDAPSMGPADDGRPTHVRGLGAGMVFVEVLHGLDQLPERGAVFCFLPIKVEGGTGAPGRAVGFVPPGPPTGRP